MHTALAHLRGKLPRPIARKKPFEGGLIGDFMGFHGISPKISRN
jgi:hypothetical protein